jgi:Zn-dependent protease with chaperone function
MHPKPLRAVGLATAAFVLLAPRAPAAQDEGGDSSPPPQGRLCSLQLTFDERGTAQVALSLFAGEARDVRPGQVEQALRKVFGGSLTDLKRTQLYGVLMLRARAEEAFPPEDGQIAGELDLTPLVKVVRPLGVEQVQVLIVDGRPPPRGLFPAAPDARASVPQYYQVATADPRPVPFVLPRRTAGWLRPAGILAGLFLAPLALVLWQRRAALRAAPLDPARAWFRFWRWAHWITLGTWLAWLTAADYLLGPAWPPGAPTAAARWAVTLIPPWLVTAFSSALAQEVFARLTNAPRTPGEVLRRAAWGIATTLLPLFLAVLGLLSLLGGQYRPGALWLLAALAVRVVALRLAAGGEDLAPHAVTSGELRDRIFDLARQAGVALRQLYVVPTGKMPQANAFAVQGGSVLVTDHLLRSLTRREVDAIAAHELGHLKFRHPAWLLALFFAAVFLPGMALPLVPEWWHGSWVRHLPLGLVLALAALYFVSRRFEYQTDSYAAWLTGDPEALITGLIKVHKLNLLPMRWGKWEEGLLTHPSTDLRLEAIARQNGVSRRRLLEIIDAPDQPGEHYALPGADSDEGLIFSTALKARSATRNSRALLAAQLLPPALIAWAVWLTGPGVPATLAALAAGAVLTCAILLLLQNYLPPWDYPRVRRKLAERLKAQGIDPSGWGGVFVSFAPDSGPRLYENWTNWDFGFLFLRGDSLCYVGERARFALRRDQLTGARLGPDVPRWWRAPYLYVSWEDRERGEAGTFNVRAGDARSMRQLRRATADLGQALRQWWEQPASPAEVPPALGGLSSPRLGEVTSAAVRDVLTPAGMIVQTGFVFLLGLALSLLIGLPFAGEQGPLGWYVPAVAALGLWFNVLPLWREHHRPAEPVQPMTAPDPGAGGKI